MIITISFRSFVSWIALALSVWFMGTANAANWCVRPIQQGSNTGTDWNDAWSMSSLDWSKVRPGDTVWLAGGTYTSPLVVTVSGSASAPITIMRATGNDSAATSSPGWNSSFDSQVVIMNCAPGIDIPNSSYITIDGHENSGSLMNNTRVYGIKVVTGANGGSAVEAGENYNTGATVSVTNLSFKNIDVLGPYYTISNPSPNADYGFNLCPYNSSRTNLLFHDCRVAGMCESFRENMWTNAIIEYCYIADEANDGDDHEDVDLYYYGKNEIWRYNIIVNSPNDGIAIGPDGYGPWYFYGNIYYNSYNWIIKFDGSSGVSMGPYYVLNNVFATSSTNPDFANTAPGWVQNIGVATAGSEIYNNIFYNIANRTISGVACDYNAYNYTNLFGDTPPSEAHGIIFSGNPFVNSAAGDFHLTAAAAANFANGIALTQDGYINYDLDGNQRGNPWYIGAYQYTGSTQAPAAPTGLRIENP